MTKLENYLNDGANRQARAVLALIQTMTIEESWNAENKEYDAKLNVARWENCREQGYIISLETRKLAKQLNIIFFEHRNSDNICAVKWEQSSMNSITIETAKFGDLYKDKYGKILEMANWIEKQFVTFWKENHKKDLEVSK